MTSRSLSYWLINLVWIFGFSRWKSSKKLWFIHLYHFWDPNRHRWLKCDFPSLIYYYLSLICDQSHRSSSIRLEMAWGNPWEGQIAPMKMFRFWWKCYLLVSNFWILLCRLAIFHYKNNKTVKYALSENNLSLFPHPIVCL